MTFVEYDSRKGVTFPLVISLMNPSYSDKPCLCFPGGRSKRLHQAPPGQAVKVSCWGQTNREIQTSNSCPGDRESSRVRDTGVNKNLKVLLSWGWQSRVSWEGGRHWGSGLPRPQVARKASQECLLLDFIKTIEKIMYLKGPEVLRFL